MKYQLLMECRAGVRHAFRTVMIIVLPGNLFKLHKVCSQCGSEKFPVWNARGIIVKSPAYKHSAEYREFLNDHNPVEARLAILNSDVKRVEAPHEKGSTVLRSVSGKQQTRRRNARPVKRTKDKRRVA